MPAHDFEIEEAEHEGIGFVHRRGPARILVNGRHGWRARDHRREVGVRRDGRFSPTFDQEDRRESRRRHGDPRHRSGHRPRGPGRRRAPRSAPGAPSRSTPTRAPPRRPGSGRAATPPRAPAPSSTPSPTDAARPPHPPLLRWRHGPSPARPMVQLKQFHRLDDVYDRNSGSTSPPSTPGAGSAWPRSRLGFTPEQARCEANRCLRCFANILLDVERCVLCALCADVCPVDVISWCPPRRSTRTARAAPPCCSTRPSASAAPCASNVAPPTPCRWGCGPELECPHGPDGPPNARSPSWSTLCGRQHRRAGRSGAPPTG
jgi:hypothetical protein